MDALTRSQIYHLPLLPGYSQDANVRSSLPPKTAGGKSMLANMTDVEEAGYEGTYFADPAEYNTDPEGFIPSSSPPQESRLRNRKKKKKKAVTVDAVPDDVEDMSADVIFFQYGVVVFYGLDEEQERSILEDVANAGIWIGGRDEDRWEIEQCHYVVRRPHSLVDVCLTLNRLQHDPSVAFPRIYNDFFSTLQLSDILAPLDGLM